MLKRVRESRHPCRTPTGVSYAAVEEDGTSGLVIEVFDDLDKVCADVVLVLMLLCWRYFSHRIRRLKICSVVLLPALKPASSSAMIFSACGFNLFSMIFSMTLLG